MWNKTSLKIFLVTKTSHSMNDIIPFDARAYSQLSVAKYYWGITIQWKEYKLDYDGCTIENGKLKVVEWEMECYPDLVKWSVLVKLDIEIRKSKNKEIPEQDSLFPN